MLELVRTRTERAVARIVSWDLDEPHEAVWQGIRHLFPAHATPTQADCGILLVSWTLRDGRRACTQWAAPILIRIEPGLLLALWTCDPEERVAIACLQADTVRDGLDDYDPHSRMPTCGVIVLGDG
jgi:hypothetical protein